MKRILFFVILSSTLINNLPAQEMEIQLDGDMESCFVQPTSEDGFLLFYEVDTVVQQKPPQLAGSKCYFRKYTSDFQLIWRKVVKIPGKYDYESHFWDNDLLYVLLINKKNPIDYPYMVVSISGESGELSTAEGVIPANFQLTKFSGVNGFAYIGGQTKIDPLEQAGRILSAFLIIPLYAGVLQYDSQAICVQVDMKTGKSKSLPENYYGSSRVEQLIPNYRARAMTEVVFQRPDKHENRVRIKEHAEETLVRSLNLKPRDDHRPINIRLSHINREDCIAAGSYAWAYTSQRLYRNMAAAITGTRASEYAQGMYVARFSNNGQKFIQFFPFQLFKEFYEEFEYPMKRLEKPEEEEEEEEEIDKSLLTRKQLRKLERREERELQREQRMSRRLSKRPAKELLPDFKLLFHPPVEMGQDYLIIAELYRPSGEGGDGESGSAPITIGGGKNASGFDHFHTLIAAVDKRTGAFSWQTSFPFEARSDGELKPQIQLISQADDYYLMLVPEEGQMAKKLLGSDGSIADVETVSLPTDEEANKMESFLTPWTNESMMFWSYEKPTPLNTSEVSRSAGGTGGRKLVVKRVEF